MGVYAVEPEGDEPISAILAGPYGGNLDLWELTEGTSLFLPVFKPGARVWTGDANATQSDGVVDQTGIESAMEELRVQYTVHKGVTLAGPAIETPESWIVMAFADSLDVALPNCVRTAIDWLHIHGGVDRRDAYALCSMTVSFRVTQWADQTGSVYSSDPASHDPWRDPQVGPGCPGRRPDRRLDASAVVTLSAAESLEIMQLVTRADDCATSRDADGYALLFTADGAMTGGMGSATGRAALRDAVAAVWAGATAHPAPHPQRDDRRLRHGSNRHQRDAHDHEGSDPSRGARLRARPPGCPAYPRGVADCVKTDRCLTTGAA